MTPIERVTERATRNGDPNDERTPRPLLTLDEFFDGNEVAGSIGCNLDPMPEPREMYALLRAIATRADVADVRVQVTMFDDPDWPFSDTVWVITSASPSDVASWFSEDWRPDSVGAGWLEGVEYEQIEVPSGYEPVGCWWD